MYDRLGPVRYITPALEPMVAFYRDVLGFVVRRSDAAQVVLGAPDRDLVILDLVAGARRPGKTTGLYHTAFLLPNHRDLVHLLGRIATTRTPVEGFNHHGTHEAIYLPDPDGNGVELAWDLAEEEWPRKDGGIDFLAHDKVFDPEAVLGEFEADAEPWPGVPVGTRIGHVHLHVGDLASTEKFYTELLAMDVKFRWATHGALFLAAEGYHHHLGANLWKGKNLPPAPEGSVGLAEFTWKVPAPALPALRRRLDEAGYPTVDRPAGFAVKDSQGVGIAIAPL